MYTTTRSDILNYLKKYPGSTPQTLSAHFKVSRQMIFRHIKNLLSEGLITKNGVSPHVTYSAASTLPQFSPEVYTALEQEFLHITPLGKRLEGAPGFLTWCNLYKKAPAPEAALYAQQVTEVLQHPVNTLARIYENFPTLYIDELYSLSPYTLPEFGSTRLGTLVRCAKGAQDADLAAELFTAIEPLVRQAVASWDIDAIAFIPPTISRALQLQDVLKNFFNFDQRCINISRLEADKLVPQKYLQIIPHRVSNIRRSMHIEHTEQFRNILLVDDAITSGATMNEVARKLRESGVAGGKIFGIGIVDCGGIGVSQEI